MSVDQAVGIRPFARAADTGAERAAQRRVAVLSGKGGVGKTNLVANLAVAAARLGARVLVIDGDLGLANVDVLLGLTPRRSVADVLDGACTLEEVLVRGPRGIHVLPAASGRPELAGIGGAALDRLVGLLPGAEEYDLVLVDAGAGVGPAVVGLAAACRRALVMTTPEPTSFADAYAALKVLRRHAPLARPELLVNGVRREREAHELHGRLRRLSRRFLDTDLAYRGHLPADPRLADAVLRQTAVVEAFPSAPSSRHLTALASTLLQDTR